MEPHENQPDDTEAPEADVSKDVEERNETTLDLDLERIDTEGVLKEGFAGQEM